MTLIEDENARFVGFAGTMRLGVGPLDQIAVQARWTLDIDPLAAILIFDGRTGTVVDLDLRGTVRDVMTRYSKPEPEPARRGRPRLGVVAREVTLLPRHWDWLSRQPGGASTVLRRLVENALRSEADAEKARERMTAAYRFMMAMAGNLEGFEEAARALFAGDRKALEARMAAWPADVRVETLAYLDGANAS